VGDPALNAFSFLNVFDGSQVRSTSSQPFLSFTNSSVDSSGDIVSVRRSSTGTPSRLILAGPLFSATNSTFNTTSLGFLATFGTSANACCNAFAVMQGAQVSSTGTSAFIQLTNSTFVINDSQSGVGFFRISDTFTGAPASELVAPASVSLAGPLLSATNSTITALFDIVQVQRSSLSSTSSSPLISMTGGSVTLGGTNPIDGQTVFGNVMRTFSSSTSGTVASAASVSLAGPLFSMNGGTVTKNANILQVLNGATFASTTTSALISLTNGATIIGTTPSPFSGAILNVQGFGSSNGTTPASATLGGPLLTASGSTINMPRDLFLGAINGGTVIANDPTQPFVSLSGGTHSVGTQAFTQLFRLTGLNTATDTDTNITSIQIAPITVGTDRPLQRSGTGAFLSLSSGATLNTNEGLFLDTALLNASASLLDMSGGSSLTTAGDGINLNQKAKLTAIGPVIKVNGSTLNVNGSAFRVAGGSGFTVSGDLVSVINGGTVNIPNGALLFASGGSVVNVTGAPLAFGGTAGNTINITNNFCTSCTIINTLRVETRNGATPSNITMTGTAVRNVGLGTVNLGSASTAIIVIDGANTKVNFSGL